MEMRVDSKKKALTCEKTKSHKAGKGIEPGSVTTGGEWGLSGGATRGVDVKKNGRGGSKRAEQAGGQLKVTSVQFSGALE